MIQFRRGLEVSRIGQSLADGQPLVTLDQFKLYIGSGSQNGGYAITASLSDTASIAITSSYSLVSSTASVALFAASTNINTSSFVVTASGAIDNRSASYAINCQTAEIATVAAFAASSSYSQTASIAVSSSYANSSSNSINSNNSITSSYSQTSSFSQTSISSSYSLTASFAITASNTLSSSYSATSSVTQTALNVDYSNVTNKPTLVSSSQQVANFNGFPITASVISASSNIQASTFQGNGFNLTTVDYNKLVNTPSQLTFNIPTASLTDLIYYSNNNANADGIVGGAVVNAGFKLVSIIASSSNNTIINLGTQSLSNAIVNTEVVRPIVDEIPLGKQFFSNTNSASLYVSSPNWGGNSVNLICKYEKIAGDQLSATALAINVHGYITSASIITASNNDVILVQTTNGPVSVYLPASFNNSQITVKKITGDTATVTVFPSGSQQIDSDGPLIISHYNDAVTMVGNGNAWWII